MAGWAMPASRPLTAICRHQRASEGSSPSTHRTAGRPSAHLQESALHGAMIPLSYRGSRLYRRSFPGWRRLPPRYRDGQGQGIVHLTLFDPTRWHEADPKLHTTVQTSCLPGPSIGRPSTLASVLIIRGEQPCESAGVQLNATAALTIATNTAKWPIGFPIRAAFAADERGGAKRVRCGRMVWRSISSSLLITKRHAATSDFVQQVLAREIASCHQLLTMAGKTPMQHLRPARPSRARCRGGPVTTEL